MALRIVQICAYGLRRHGGVQSHVRDVAGALLRRGHQVRCYSPPAGNPAPDLATCDVLEVGKQHTIGLAQTRFELSLIDRADLSALAAEINQWRPDIVHVHGVWVPFMPWQLASRIRAAKVVSFHDTTTHDWAGFVLSGAFKALGRYVAKRVDAITATSSAPMAHLGPAALVQGISILPPVNDLGDFLGLGKAEDAIAPVVLHWGRLDRRKNIKVLLDAARLIWRGAVDWPQGVNRPRFVIAGDGTDVPLVRAAMAALGPQVVCHVPAPDRGGLLRLLEDASLCVFTAQHGEGFGLVLTEALASGTAVFAGDNPGFRANLGASGAQYLFDPRNPEQLAGKIAAFFSDADQRVRAQTWGRTHAKGFDVASHMSALEGIYESAIQSRRSKDEGSGNHA